MVHPQTPKRRSRDSSVSSWPSQEHQMTSPATSPSTAVSPLVSPGISPASAGRRTPRKSSRPVRTPHFAVEDDPTVLARRQKQIEYGKNTLAYQQYTTSVPRGDRLGYHPRTPVKRRVLSRRRWDNAIKSWRVHLHYWNDPTKLAELRSQETASDSSSVVSDPAEVMTSAAGTEPTGAEVAAALATEPDAAAGKEAEKGNAAEAAAMDEGAGGAMGLEVAEGDTALNWADDVEELAMEIVE